MVTGCVERASSGNQTRAIRISHFVALHSSAAALRQRSVLWHSAFSPQRNGNTPLATLKKGNTPLATLNKGWTMLSSLLPSYHRPPLWSLPP
eukprot:5044859-Amphidinium_carterae.1